MQSRAVRSLMSVFLPHCMRLPACAPEPLKRGCRAMVLVSIPLWALGVIGWREGWTGDGMGLARAAAAATLAIAGACWAVAHQYDEDRRRTTLGLADALDRLPEDQLRELLMRDVSGQ